MTVETGEEVLRVNGLKVVFHTYAGDVKALDGVELSIRKGEMLGLVGESGCGKSATALAIVGLLPQNAEVVSGEVILDGTNLLSLGQEEMRRVRLREIAIVFQDPLSYLNPVLTIGAQMTEIIDAEPEVFIPLIVKDRLSQLEKEVEYKPEASAERERLSELKSNRLPRGELKRLARLYCISTLRSVKLPRPEKVFNMYPFELSGGMRQRAMIAMALLRRPRLLLADEITTALDVTVQAQILQLLSELKEEMDASIILITHDLAVVAEVCDRVSVMYAGNVVETANVDELFRNPLHPYTKGLLGSIPRVDAVKEQIPIDGSVPDLLAPPSGCRFHPRCPYAFSKCSEKKPVLVDAGGGHKVACFLYGE